MIKELTDRVLEVFGIIRDVGISENIRILLKLWFGSKKVSNPESNMFIIYSTISIALLLRQYKINSF